MARVSDHYVILKLLDFETAIEYDLSIIEHNWLIYVKINHTGNITGFVPCV